MLSAAFRSALGLDSGFRTQHSARGLLGPAPSPLAAPPPSHLPPGTVSFGPEFFALNSALDEDCSGHGSTDGIGRETALRLLSRGLHVLVHGRSESKATRQVKALSGGYPGAQATPVWGDLSDMHQVVTLARQVRRHSPLLDVLINNAGVLEKRRKLTGDGFKMTT